MVEMPGWVRWILLLFGIAAVFVGLGMISGGLALHGGGPPGEPDSSGLLIAAIGVASFVLGWALAMLAFPTFTAITGAAVAPVAALTAVVLASAAVALARTSDSNFDTTVAAADAVIGATLALATAVALGCNFVLWRRRPGSFRSLRHVLHVAAIGWGASLVSQGLGLAVAAVANMAQAGGMSGADRFYLERAVLLAGTAAISIGSGAILVWHGAAALTGVPSTRYRPPSIWKPALGAVTAIGLGELILQTQTALGLVPLMHVAAVVLPGLTILALVSNAGRRGRPGARSTWREVLLMAAYGAAVAATIAGIVNTVALFSGLVAAANLVRDTDLTDASNGVLLVLLLIGLSVVVPLDEEFWKGFGVRLLRNHRPTRYQAFLWGLASGVGFGAVEANEYGFGALRQSPYRWWDGVLLRGSASSLHALASGTVGIAWFYMFRGKRLRFFGLYLVAVGLHGSWNALNLLTVARVLPGFKRVSDHDLEIALEVILAAISVLILTMLWALARSLAREDDASSDDTPPAAPALVPALDLSPRVV